MTCGLNRAWFGLADPDHVSRTQFRILLKDPPRLPQHGSLKLGRVEDRPDIHVRNASPEHRHFSGTRCNQVTFSLFRLRLAHPCSILAR